MVQTIHPIFSSLNISTSAKTYFTDQKFLEIVQDTVYIDTNDDKNEESRKNWWTFSVNQNLCSEDDIRELFTLIISYRQKFLETYHKNVKMIFYVGYDEQDGHLSFSLVQDKYEKLPFGCIVNKVDRLDTIIQHDFEDKNKGFIPWSELKEIDIDDALEIEEPKYTLDV